MRALCMSIAACLAIVGAAARAGGVDEAKVREALKTQAEKYLATTRDDLKSDRKYPNLAVNLVSSTVEPGDSLVTPYTAEVRYILEYDSPANKGERVAHPFLMTCSYFDGRWDISPHGHREGKNVKDLDPEKSTILFPNI